MLNIPSLFNESMQDMYPYSEEALAPSQSEHAANGDEGGPPSPSLNSRDLAYYTYHLHGIIAHVGAINSGHYYSFIRNPTEQSGSFESSGALGEWTEFNDSRVAAFDPKEIPYQCFGGRRDAEADAVVAPSFRQHNAYMLVYQRKPSNSGEKMEIPIAGKLLKALLFENNALLRDKQMISK